MKRVRQANPKRREREILERWKGARGGWWGDTVVVIRSIGLIEFHSPVLIHTRTRNTNQFIDFDGMKLGFLWRGSSCLFFILIVLLTSALSGSDGFFGGGLGLRGSSSFRSLGRGGGGFRSLFWGRFGGSSGTANGIRNVFLANDLLTFVSLAISTKTLRTGEKRTAFKIFCVPEFGSATIK